MIIKSLKISEPKHLPIGRIGHISPLIYLTSILFIILSLSCQDDKISYAEDCEFALSLTANTQLSAQTRVSDMNTLLPEPNIDNFKVQVLNPSGKLLKEWEHYSEVANPIKIQTGTFTLKASYGEQHTGAFDAPYFEGSTEFGVRRGQQTEVAVTCYLANVMVTTSYTDKFKAYFKDYRVNVSSSGNPVIFLPTTTKAAFFEPGQLCVTMDLTKQDGTSFAFPAAQISKTKGKEYYRFNFDLTGDPGNEKLLVSFNTSTIDSTIMVDVSQGWITGEPPVYFNTGFTSGQELSYMEGTESPTAISTLITAPSRIKSCVISTSSDQLIQAGWPAKEIDLVQIDNNTKAQLKAMGLKWTERLSGLNMAQIDFTGIVPHLPGGEQDIKHIFSIKTTDAWGQTTPQPLTVAFITSTPNFNLLPQSDVWVKTTNIDFNLTLTKGDIKQIRLEYNNGKDETWLEMPYTADGGGNNYILKAHNINFTSPIANIRAIYGKAGKTFPISFRVLNPTLQIEQNGLPWAKRIFLNLNETNSDFLFKNDVIENEIRVQILVNGTWVDKTFKIQKGSTSTDPIHVEVTGLTDNTQQQLRVIYDGGIGETASNNLEFKTEEVKIISAPTNWDFFYNKNINKGGKYGRFSFTASYDKSDISGQNPDSPWITVNTKTIPNSVKTENTWYMIPSTIPTSNGILIRNVAWSNNGNEPEGKISASGVSLNDLTPPTITHRSAGKLFLGEYSVSHNKDAGTVNEIYNYGIPFEGRPTGIQFKYKFTPLDNGENGLISAFIEAEDGSKIATLEKSLSGETQVIKYNFTYININKKAAKISILFSSSDQCSNDQNKETNRIKTKNLNECKSQCYSTGSELYIDDIELIYE